MEILQFENSMVDQFLNCVADACDIKRREEAFKKVQSLLTEILDDSCEITTFGSGPLKTYLPESDIDLTILFKESLLRGQPLDTPSKVGAFELDLLKESLEENEERFNIKDVSTINAAVKLIKLQCDGIPIDISFNQIGGIISYKYLEEVDETIGQDHLFKKAILIMKGWCMYTGRILGSNIGCFSSYSLEVLILSVIINHDI